MKKVLALIFAFVIMCACAYAQSGDYQYAEAENGVYITGYSGSEAHVWIPGELDGKPVTGISDGAFRGNTSIVTLHIPDSVEIIGVEAFQNCTALRDVHLGKGIEHIKAYAFDGCTALLNIALLTDDFYIDSYAFEGSSVNNRYNGGNMSLIWAEFSGEDYERLYAAAHELMYRGDFEAARDIFLSLYGYDLSADYYFYCSARIYENRGMTEEALAIYGLMPDFYDCGERIEYYGGQAEMDNFFDSPDYTEYYDEYFGSGGAYENWQDMAAEEQAETAAEDGIIGGADEPTGIVLIGGALVPEGAEEAEAPADDSAAVGIGAGLINAGGEETEAEATAEPENAEVVLETIVLEENPALISFHDYTGEMPYEFSDYSKSDGYYVIYYFMDNVEVINDYLKIFTDEGWQVMTSDQSGGWNYVTVVSPDYAGYFYVSYSEADGIIGLMFESAIDYGFDPANGL